MEPITITPDPTGFAAKLTEAQASAIAKITQLQDLNTAPQKIATLADINSIVQWSKIVKLQGEILTELQLMNQPQSTTWIDEAGNYYQSRSIDGEIQTLTPGGELYIPTGKSRPASSGVLVTAECAPSEVKFTRRQGTEQLVVEAGAKYICVVVSAGEVSCSNGDGVLIAGTKLEFSDENGMTQLIFDGDTDSDYLVATRYPAVIKAVEIDPEDEVIGDAQIEVDEAEDAPALTGDLLPLAHDLVLETVDVLAA